MNEHRIHIVVLAAGCSQRFGTAKLLETWQGRPLVRHAVRAAQAFAPGRVFLVTGHRGEEIAAAGAADHTVPNPGFRDGIGNSIACGVRAAREGADGIIIQLGDTPLVEAAHLGNLAARWGGTDDAIVATRAGNLGPPVLFGRSAFDALCELDGDRGAREVMRDARFTLREIEFAAAGVDIDRPADLVALRRR